MTEIAIDFEAAKKDMAALTAAHYQPGTAEDELLAAAEFVFRYGALGDTVDEPTLARFQFWVGPPGAAFTLIGHWSVSRNDPLDGKNLADDYINHARTCRVCDFLENTWDTRVMFEFENCATCGSGINSHAITMLPIGQPGMVCGGHWQRAEPTVEDAGEVSFRTQVGDAYRAKWFAPLADGSFAVVTRTYFVSNHDMRITLSRIDTYIICSDPNDPVRTWIDDDSNFVELDSDNPQAENLIQVTTDSFSPEPGEWQEYGPDSDNFTHVAA